MASGGVTTQRAKPRRPPVLHVRTRRGKPLKRSNRLLPWFAVGLVVAIVAVFVVVKAVSHPQSAGSTSSVPASVAHAVADVPASAFDEAGASAGLTAPKPLPASTPPLTVDGLPRILYVGAEYCPYCAAERWAVVVALSRFGAFAGLGATESSAIDVFPRTPSFTFYGSSFRSDYLAFSSVELQTNQPAADGGYTRLQDPTLEEQRLLGEFDREPYTTSPGAIPFLDIGNRFVMVGATFDPTVLQGLTVSQIAGRLADPASDVGGAVLGSANLLTAAICEATGDQPGTVCSSRAVIQAKARLGVSR